MFLGILCVLGLLFYLFIFYFLCVEVILCDGGGGILYFLGWGILYIKGILCVLELLFEVILCVGGYCLC